MDTPSKRKRENKRERNTVEDKYDKKSSLTVICGERHVEADHSFFFCEKKKLAHVRSSLV